MSIHLFLVRHALKQKAVGDVPITPEGINQALLTARYFGTLPVTAIVSSPLRRAKETAEYIALETNSTVKVDNRLRERANWGDLPGQTFEEFVEMWDRSTREPDYVPPIGDSARQASDRMFSLLLDLVNDYPSGSNVVLVTHGGLITDFLVNFFSENVLNKFHTNFIAEQSQLISECSITKLIYDRGQYTIDTFGSVEHFSRH